jgi:hypothetical protein
MCSTLLLCSSSCNDMLQLEPHPTPPISRLTPDQCCLRRMCSTLLLLLRSMLAPGLIGTSQGARGLSVSTWSAEHQHHNCLMINTILCSSTAFCVKRHQHPVPQWQPAVWPVRLVACGCAEAASRYVWRVQASVHDAGSAMPGAQRMSLYSLWHCCCPC